MRLLRFNESILMLGPVKTNKYGLSKSISWLNNQIAKYTSNIYGPYGYVRNIENTDINIDGIIISSEYISKMVNNYTVFKKIISLNNITSEDDFYSFMIDNLEDIYHFNGKYFNTVTLPIIINTSRKGNIGEQDSLRFFEDSIFKKTNIRVTVQQPTLAEDVSGIDGKFIWNGKEVTIQVKPYESASISKSTRMVKVYSQGSLSLNTSYLIVYKEGRFIIIKGKDVEIEGNYFIFPESAIVSKS